MLASNLRKLLAVGVMAALAAGCGAEGGASVSGKVAGPDGSPLGGAVVIARNKETGASGSGETGSDGSYRLNGGEGVPPGEYSVTVLAQRMSLQDSDGVEAKIPAKYGSHDTSGLSFSVEAGDSKEFNIQIDNS